MAHDPFSTSRCAQGKRLLKCFATSSSPSAGLTLYHFMAQQVLTHPHADQALRFRALSSGSEAIAAAAAKWVLGVESECAGLAPVTVDTFHVHLPRDESSSVFSTVKLQRIKLE